MNDPALALRWLPGRYAVCRLEPAAPLPPWAEPPPGGLISLTRTEAECSLVVAQDRVPDGVRAQRGFRALWVEGPLDFSSVGILARLTAALARNGVPVFVISTFDTDLLLVREAEADRAAAALREVAEIGPG